MADRELPRNMSYEWTELSFLQEQSRSVESIRDLQHNPFSAFGLGVVLIFVVLAGLYESWSRPLTVILVVPMCLLPALAGIAMSQMDINIYVQIGFVVLVGLACKNSILIVEFARDREQEGASRFEAALEAARECPRPIIMTSLAFIGGVFPLVIAQGAGAEMLRTLGTAVLYGMIGVTVFGIFLTQVFYYVVRWFSDRRQATPAPAPARASANSANGSTVHPAQVPATKIVEVPVFLDYSQPLPQPSAEIADESFESEDSLPPEDEATQQAMDLFDQAKVAFKDNDYKEALRRIDSAIEVLPSDATLHEFRALCLFAMKDYQQAAATIYAVLAAGPGWNWETMASLYRDTATHTQQLRALEAHVGNNPNDSAAAFLLAYQYMTMGHLDAAVGKWERVAELLLEDELTAQLLEAFRPGVASAAEPAERK